jgi:hypothetical protein
MKPEADVHATKVDRSGDSSKRHVKVERLAPGVAFFTVEPPTPPSGPQYPSELLPLYCQPPDEAKDK